MKWLGQEQYIFASNTQQLLNQLHALHILATRTQRRVMYRQCMILNDNKCLRWIQAYPAQVPITLNPCVFDTQRRKVCSGYILGIHRVKLRGSHKKCIVPHISIAICIRYQFCCFLFQIINRMQLLTAVALYKYLHPTFHHEYVIINCLQKLPV